MFKGLELWNKVEVTDPRFTKPFNRGNFKGTAVDALGNIKRLTEHFGPVGQNWGWKVLSERLDTFGEGKDAQTIHSLTLRAWFMQPGGQVHEFDHIGHTKVAYWTRGSDARLVVDDEYGKKSLTDALSKVMVCLGASADVWLGRFDGNKYYEPPPSDDVADGQDQPKRQTRQPVAAKANGHVGAGPARSPAEEVDAALGTPKAPADDPLRVLALPLRERIKTLEWQLSKAAPAKAAELWLVYAEHVKSIGRPKVYDALEDIVTSKALPPSEKPNLLMAG